MNQSETATSRQHTVDLQSRLTSLHVNAETFANELAERPNLGSTAAPAREIERCAELGLLTAPLSAKEGGVGLGVSPGTQLASLQILSALGSGDLALGRIYEGHLNALLLIQTFGTPEQVSRLSEDCRRGALFGVWNTGAPTLLKLSPLPEQRYRFSGCKTFATAAALVERPIVTAELPGGGWQMCCPSLPSLNASIDKGFWHPLGMESSESYGIDFTGAVIAHDDLIGHPGDFYRDPLFRGGAIRFSAVQAGAASRLHTLFTEWLKLTHRQDDPYQIARLGEIALAAQAATLWIERAAAEAEASFFRKDLSSSARMVSFANMTRLAIESACTGILQHITVGVGARGLLQPHRFERILRDLTMYLRQPAPDETRATVGRASLQGTTSAALWKSADDDAQAEPEAVEEPTLPPDYFHDVYQQNEDPWNFETSPYEAAKYATTLASLPQPLYRRAFEVGCSIGVLTELLASRCQQLLSVDVSEKALAKARRRCALLPNVTFERMQVPEEEPIGNFDLIVVSEVGYYWSAKDLPRAINLLASHHSFGGHLILVHWTPDVPDYPISGDRVHDLWIAQPGYRLVHHLREDQFRLDVLERIA